MDILYQLYNGEIFPAEQFKPILDAYREKLAQAREHEKSFVSELSESQKKAFDLIMDDLSLLSPLELTQVYADGFTLGAKLIIELYTQK